VKNATPQITDERVIIIANFIGSNLNRHGLEVEAKLGCFDSLANSQNSYLFKIFQDMRHMVILPDIQGCYRFIPGLDKKLFYYIKSLFEMLSKDTKNEIKDIGEREDRDQFYNDNVRVTFNSNGDIVACIKKQDKRSINILNGGKDFRITCSSEVQIENRGFGVYKIERRKLRQTFEFRWLQFDFTKTETRNFEGEVVEKDAYEIEVEVKDLSFLIANFNIKEDKTPYYKVIERFLINVNNIYELLSDQVFERIYMKPRFIEMYKEKYGDQVPRPVVGDYLTRLHMPAYITLKENANGVVEEEDFMNGDMDDDIF